MENEEGTILEIKGGLYPLQRTSSGGGEACVD